MEPLEQVTVLMTLMQRLGQVLEHERAILRGMRLDGLSDIQDEKAALAEAYEIELARLRRSPETIAGLEPAVRGRLHDAMRELQDAIAANLNALLAAQSVIERIMDNIGQSLAASGRGPGYQAGGQAAAAAASGQVISVAFDRRA